MKEWHEHKVATMKDRKPKTIMMYVELEDNVGSVLAKGTVETSVTLTDENSLEPHNIEKLFNKFLEHLRTTTQLNL